MNASDAWSGEKKAHPREAYVAGFERGAFEERMRLVAFISDNQETLKDFAGDKGMDLLTYMLANMRAWVA